VIESCAKFPYLEDSSHTLLVSSLLRAVKKKFNPISLIFFGNPLVSLKRISKSILRISRYVKAVQVKYQGFQEM